MTDDSAKFISEVEAGQHDQALGDWEAELLRARRRRTAASSVDWDAVAQHMLALVTEPSADDFVLCPPAPPAEP
ncbi:hypothetical protein [Actinomadura sp. 21ATH]|uniref:hypothetical protein n=1 Tax=Actinomadura sp. 21ATH TaxID=1735444 RepID=UPI0035BF7843